MKQFLLILLFSCFTTLALAQASTVSGRVFDDNSKPVDGATIILKELNKMTITDINGKYEISG
ncbi:MAG: hypothetical protein EOP46_18705, partial [Sphingobacteriaceae bacterium]